MSGNGNDLSFSEEGFRFLDGLESVKGRPPASTAMQVASAYISSTTFRTRTAGTARRNQGANASDGTHLYNFFFEYYVAQLVASAGIRLRPWNSAAILTKYRAHRSLLQSRGVWGVV